MNSHDGVGWRISSGSLSSVGTHQEFHFHCPCDPRPDRLIDMVDTLTSKVDDLYRLALQVLNKEHAIMSALDDLETTAEGIREVDVAVVATLDTIHAELVAALEASASVDPRIQAVVDKLGLVKDDVAAAIVRNTDVDPTPTPDPEPTPEPIPDPIP